MTTEQYKAMMAGRTRLKNKYGNVKVEVGEITFDSQKEANRYMELRILQRAGKISDLRRQVPFQLIPQQRDHCTGKVIERPLTYIADFVYKQDGREVVEDTKGLRTKEYLIKRKLMLYFNGIRIAEV